MKANNSAYGAFSDIVGRYGDKTALIYLGEKFTYNRLKALSLRVASSFRDLGIGKGDSVILYIPNCPQWVVTWLGLQRIGAVAVPVTPIYTLHDLEYIATDSRAKAILCGDTNFGYVKQLRERGVLDKIIVTNLSDMLPRWKWSRMHEAGGRG